MKKPTVIISYRFLRFDTTGVHCQEALYDLIGKENVTFIDADQFSMQYEDIEADLLLAIDDDSGWTFPQDWKGLRVLWLVDTHTNYEKRVARAKYFDKIFAAQLRGVWCLNDDGYDCDWLPLACNPRVHYQIEDCQKCFDWSFVGNVPRDQWLPIDRADIIDALQKAYPKCFIGKAWRDDMMQIFSSSCVIFNRSIIDDLNMRVFEATATGTPLLTNNVHGQDRLFESDMLYTYDTLDNAVEYMGMILESDDFLNKRIGMKARNHTLKYHTYKHRMQELLYYALDYGSLDGLLSYDHEPGDIPDTFASMKMGDSNELFRAS